MPQEVRAEQGEALPPVRRHTSLQAERSLQLGEEAGGMKNDENCTNEIRCHNHKDANTSTALLVFEDREARGVRRSDEGRNL
jgi:hypothetical protein